MMGHRHYDSSGGVGGDLPDPREHGVAVVGVRVLEFEQHQGALDDASLARYAEEAGADGEDVLADLSSGRYQRSVHDSFMSGARSGVNGTPTLFIDGIRYDGPRDEDTLVAALELVAAEASPR